MIHLELFMAKTNFQPLLSILHQLLWPKALGYLKNSAFNIRYKSQNLNLLDMQESQRAKIIPKAPNISTNKHENLRKYFCDIESCNL